MKGAVPSRLLRRIAVVLALLLVVVLVASLAFSVYCNRRLARASERFAAVLGSPDLNRFVLPELPDADNAATWLVAGANAVVVSEEEGDFLRSVSRTAAWSDDHEERVARILEVNRPALELLRRALDCPASNFGIDYTKGADAELPELMELMRAGRLLWFEARLALSAGDEERFHTALATLERLTEALAGESLAISSLIVMALDHSALDLAHRVVTARAPAPGLLDAVESALAGTDRRELLRRSLAAEGSMLATTSLRLLSGVEEGTVASRLLALLESPAYRLLQAGGLEDYAGLGAMAERPFAEVRVPGEESAEGLFNSLLGRILYPNLIDFVGKVKIAESVSTLAREAIRLRRHHLATGAWPEPLEQLGPDPYSGQAVSVEARPDGGLALTARGALALWREWNQHQPFAGEPHFTWVLPAALAAAGE